MTRLSTLVAVVLLLVAVSQPSVELLQLHHMEAGLGWIWDDQNRKVFPWFVIVGIGDVLLAIGVAFRWLPALVVASLWSIGFGAMWLYWTLHFWVKTARLEAPEAYLFILPPAFVVAYGIVIAGCTVLVQRQLDERLGRPAHRA